MEPDQVLRVGINAIDLGRGWQFFYTKMMQDERIHFSRVPLFVLQGEKPRIAGYLMEITLEPT